MESLTQLLVGGDNAVSRTILSVWLITALGVLMRRVPKTLVTLLGQVLTTRIYAVDDGVDIRKEFFRLIDAFVAKHGRSERYEQLSFEIVNGVKCPIPGPGRGWFFYKGVLIVFRKTVETGVASSWNGNTQHVVLRVFTRSERKLDEILSEIHMDKTKRVFRGMRHGEWTEIATMQPTAKIFLEPSIKETLDKEVLFFKNNRQWYMDRGLPWKLTILLYGKPGTGKTTVTRYIADLLGGDIYQASIKSLAAGNAMLQLVMGVKPLSVLSIEDFDDTPGMHNRDGASETEKELPALVEKNGKTVSATDGTLTQFLNTFQGLVPLHGQVTVLTTNHPERVDKAALREGRVDISIEIGDMKPEQIREFIEHSYGVSYDGDLKSYTAAQVFNAFSRNPRSHEDFITVLKSKTTSS